MAGCSICHSDESREEAVDEVFDVDGRYVLVNGIPAKVCARCGEQTFSREAVEKVRLMVRVEAKPSESVSMDVFNFLS